MKYLILLPDGASDEPLPELGGRTPLEAAHIPHTEAVAREGCLGRVVTIPEGFGASTDVGTLTLLGHDPRRYHRGRAPMEALAQGVQARPDELILRCNFVHVAEGRMKDFTAGHIAQEDAAELIAALNATVFPGETCAFHTGVSYRNLLLLSGASDLVVRTQPPHDIADQEAEPHLPQGPGGERLRALLTRAAEVLADHPVNVRRRAKGEAWANEIWLWGQGTPMTLNRLQEQYGLRAGVITAVDIIRGLALGMGMDLIRVPGATGYIDTDYAAKGRYALEALEAYDVVVVHVEAPDEAAHQGMAEEKVRALERIDAEILGPLWARLRELGDHRILVAPDHATLVRTKGHHGEPPPFAYAGTGVAASGAPGFSEPAAMTAGVFVQEGETLLKAFLTADSRPGLDTSSSRPLVRAF